MEHIKILKDHLNIGSRALKKGEVVAVAEIGTATAQGLIDTKRAEEVKPAKSEKGA